MMEGESAQEAEAVRILAQILPQLYEREPDEKKRISPLVHVSDRDGFYTHPATTTAPD